MSTLASQSPHGVWIKVCGITRQEDVAACMASAVDAMGLVFAPGSPRQVDVKQATLLTREAAGCLQIVALFMDPDEATVQRVLAAVKPDILQFHGSETVEFCTRFERDYIKALSIHDPQRDALIESHRDAIGFIVDSHPPGRAGGSGQTFQWFDIGALAPQPVILAGGLHPGNVRLAIEQASPDGLDVSSGVESEPGIKDARKIRQFVQEAGRGDPNR